MTKRLVTVLGSTGSVGVNTLDVIARHPQRFQVVALSAHRRAELLAEQCRRFAPRYAVLGDADAAQTLQQQLRHGACDTEVLYGEQALQRVATLPEVDTVMAAIVGGAGLAPTLAAAQAGKRVLLANKEALVMAGDLLMRAVAAHGAQLLPIDSEHNAIFQALPAQRQHGLAAAGVRRVVLTASGGPFRTWPLANIAEATPEQACKHPNWVMGRKISVDSATMMNKGLEFIEACWFFGANSDQVDIVIHPESIVHSMVSYIDGSVIAQLSHPDMRTPIAYGLAYPQRLEAGVAELDLTQIARLHFEALDHARFPAVRLATQAHAQGGTAAVTLNAANEIAVEAFLDRRLRFGAIVPTIESVLAHANTGSARNLDDILSADAQARQLARESIARHGGR